MIRKNGEFARFLRLPTIRHMGIVVEDIERAVKYYSDTFRMGPWFKSKIPAGENYLRGEKRINTEYETASTFSGRMEYQLIEVKGGDRDICLEHLENYGEGFHHVGGYVKNIEARLSAYREVGIGVLQTGVVKSKGKLGGIVTKYAYLDTAAIGGVIFELIQIGVVGINIGSSRFWFELGNLVGSIEKMKI
jgi:catechol 2,3-dioxygenase-like lactoylglutathione lyase family enzyme